MEAEAKDPITAWQEVHAFECPHGQGVITPETCAELRRRNDLSQSHGMTPQGKEKAFRPKSCAKCTEYQAHWDDVARRRAEAGQKRKPKTGGTAMPTYIDCLRCGKQGVPNKAKGLCQHCYFVIPKHERERYDLEEAKEKRRKRLNGESEAAAEDTPDPGDGLQLGVDYDHSSGEVEGLEPYPGKTDVGSDSSSGDATFGEKPEASDDPLAGYEFVPCPNAMQRSREVQVDGPGKFLRFGAKLVQDLGIRPGSHVHLYMGNKGLALKFLPEPDRTSYRLSRDGSASKGHHHKVTLSARKLVKDGILSPGQRFEARLHESGQVLFLDAIEGSTSA